MDKNSKPSTTRVVRAPEKTNESEGNEASSQKTRLPVRKIPPKKDSETQNVVSARKSKLPIKSLEVSTLTKKTIKPLTSQTRTTTKISSTAVVNPGGPITTTESKQNAADAEKILDNLCKILDEQAVDFNSPKFTHNERMTSTSAVQIHEITDELNTVMSKTLENVRNAGDNCVQYNEFTRIPKVDLEVPKLSEEDLMSFSKTEYLEHQINECIHDINSSAYEILDENPSQNLENVEHEIKECIDGLTLKIDTDIQPLQNQDDEINPCGQLASAKSAVLQISSSLRLLLANKGDRTAPLEERVTCSALEELAKSSSLNLQIAAETSNTQLYNKSLEDFDGDLIAEKKYDDLSDSTWQPQIVSTTEQPENDTSVMQRDVNDNEDDNSDMDDLTGNELIESIRVDLEKLRSQIIMDSKDNLNTELTAQDKPASVVQVEETKNEERGILDSKSNNNDLQPQITPVGTRNEKFDTKNVHSTDSTDDECESDDEYEFDDDVHYGNCSSCGNTTDDGNDDYDDSSDHLNILKALTSEFIQVVKSDILCATASSATMQRNRDSMDSEKTQKRYELLKLLNAMEDLFTEKHDNRPKPPDCRDLSAMENDTIETSPLAELPGTITKPTVKHMYGKDGENDRLLKVIEALDDFSNQKLEDIMELKSTTKRNRGANAIKTVNSNFKTETPVNSKVNDQEKGVIAGPSTKPIYSKSNRNSDVKFMRIRQSPSEPKYDENQNLPIQMNSKGVTTVRLIGQTKSGPATSKGGSYRKIMVERRSQQKLNTPSKLSGILSPESEIQHPDNSKSILVLHKQSKFKQLGVLSSPSNKDELNPTNRTHLPDRSSHSLDTGHSNSSNSIAAETQTSFQQIPSINEGNTLTPTVSNECFLFGNPMLSEKIVSLLNTDDMLSGRRVCRNWFEAITLSSAFWQKILIYKPMDFMVSWDEFEASGLLRCNYLNICILRCDLRDPGAVEFFRVYSSTLRFLALEQCTFSLVTLQRILFECTNLEHLELNGLPHYIMYSEAVFPTGNLPKCLTHLKSLILNNGPEVYHSSFGFMSSGTGAEMSPGFISDFLTTSESLERVRLTGWTSSTCLSLLKVLYHSRAMEKVNNVALSYIPLDALDFDHFLLLGLASQNIKLQKLELSLAEPQTEFTRGRDYANLIIREIVRDHSKTLEELILDNCPITEEVFIFEMPKLQKLSVRGTDVSTIDFQRFMPKLEYLNHAIWNNEDDPVLPRPRSQTYFGGRDLYSNSVVFMFGVICAGLSFFIFQFHPACAPFTFFVMGLCIYLGFYYFDLSFEFGW